jgi:hypothetical protein
MRHGKLFMNEIGPKRKELLAKTIADFAKAILAVGLASQFFKEFGIGIRVFMTTMIVLCLIAALWLQPEDTYDD